MIARYAAMWPSVVFHAVIVHWMAPSVGSTAVAHRCKCNMQWISLAYAVPSGPERTIRPRITTPADDARYPPTPSTVVSNTVASLQSDNLATKPRSNSNSTPVATSRTKSQSHNDEPVDLHQTVKQDSPAQTDQPLVACHVGECQGLEFLSDICQPVSVLKPRVRSD